MESRLPNNVGALQGICVQLLREKKALEEQIG